MDKYSGVLLCSKKMADHHGVIPSCKWGRHAHADLPMHAHADLPVAACRLQAADCQTALVKSSMHDNCMCFWCSEASLSRVLPTYTDMQESIIN
jgi:hypothetical protein